jgi:hypothetical protein
LTQGDNLLAQTGEVVFVGFADLFDQAVGTSTLAALSFRRTEAISLHKKRLGDLRCLRRPSFHRKPLKPEERSAAAVAPP